MRSLTTSVDSTSLALTCPLGVYRGNQSARQDNTKSRSTTGLIIVSYLLGLLNASLVLLQALVLLVHFVSINKHLFIHKLSSIKNKAKIATAKREANTDRYDL